MKQQVLVDTAGFGVLLWLAGYLLSLFLYFTPLAPILGWIILAILTPLTIGVTWLRFRDRGLSLEYFAGVGISWTAIAIVLNFLFIVLVFHPAQYYGKDVFIYYALMFLIPVGVGMYLDTGHESGRISD